MLHGINLSLLLVLLLIKPLNEELTVSLLSENDSFLNLEVNDNNPFVLELNEQRIGVINQNFKIEKNMLMENNSLALKRGNAYYSFQLSKLEDFKKYYVDKTTFYIGYHISSLDNKMRCLNYISNKIYFNRINSEIVLKDALDFSLDILPELSISNNYNYIHSYLDLFVKKGTYPYLNYAFSHYTIELEVNKIDDLYFFILNDYYYLDNSLSLYGEYKCDDLFLPNNFIDEEFYMNFTLEIDKIIFLLSYRISINNLISGYTNYFYINNGDTDENVEKKLIYSC